jgi:2-dehydro-3-deoxy-D-arabinonate dehydratase
VKLYRTNVGCFVEDNGHSYPVPLTSLDELFNLDDLHGYLKSIVEKSDGTDLVVSEVDLSSAQILPPIENQEVWAAGVTYYRSRSARMEESKSAGGGDFYDRVYSAERPELFFKATASRVAGPGSSVRIRADSKWNVPEPELTLLANNRGQIIGYTVGNDMSSRDIEGENPLYLPQAKVYDRSCALGPCVLVTPQPLPTTTPIRLEIVRGGVVAFAAETTLAELKRAPETLVEYLFRDNSFPFGTFLMTGTGIIPPDSFTLKVADSIRITIDPIGTLENDVMQGR